MGRRGSEAQRVHKLRGQLSGQLGHVCLIRRGGAICCGISGERVLTDAQWERIAVFMPSADVVKSPPVHDRRQAVGTVIYRLGCGIPWRDLPVSFGPWQTV